MTGYVKQSLPFVKQCECNEAKDITHWSGTVLAGPGTWVQPPSPRAAEIK